MKNTEFDKKTLIYELMTGALDTDNFSYPETEFVKNDFAEGEPCYQLYSDVYDAKMRLNERLDADEYKDIEIIIDGMFQIAKELCMKMYKYEKTVF